MAEKSKFTTFEDDLEDDTATAEAEKGGDDVSENDKDKDESGEKNADDDNESKGDGQDEGSAGEPSDSDNSSGKREEGKGKEGEDGKGEKKSETETAKTESKSESGKDTSGKDENSEGDREGKDEGKDEAKGTDGKETEKGKTESEDDFFADSDEGADKSIGKEGETSYKPILDKLGIDYEGNDPEEIVTKVKEKIEAAKQDVKLDNYSEQARSLIKHLNENKGDIGTFLTNPTVSEMQGILNMEPEDKVRLVRLNEIQKEGSTEEEAITLYNEELNKMSVSDIRRQSDAIDQQAMKLRDAAVIKITGDREAQLRTQREAEDTQNLRDRNTLKNYIQTQEEFLGIKLTQKAKAQILADLETGNLDKFVEKSPEASKFFAYMATRFGTKIMENFSKAKVEANREGYNKATDKQVSALHNDKKSAVGKTASGHQPGEGGSKKNFDTWQDGDLFGGPDE